MILIRREKIDFHEMQVISFKKAWLFLPLAAFVLLASLLPVFVLLASLLPMFVLLASLLPVLLLSAVFL